MGSQCKSLNSGVILSNLKYFVTIRAAALCASWSLWMDFIGNPSGVVGRERMGTAFPHKKLRGNGVPTREILRGIFSLLLLNYSYFPLLPCYNILCTSIKPCVKTGHQNFNLQSIKTNFQWCMLHLYSRRAVSQNSFISFNKCTSIIRYYNLNS